jgi:hypothetical protein
VPLVSADVPSVPEGVPVAESVVSVGPVAVWLPVVLVPVVPFVDPPVVPVSAGVEVGSGVKVGQDVPDGTSWQAERARTKARRMISRRQRPVCHWAG